ARATRGGYLPASALTKADARHLAVSPGFPVLENVHALALIDVEKGRSAGPFDLKVDPGKSRVVRILDPDGKPLPGGPARRTGTCSVGSPRRARGKEVVVKYLAPGKPRWLFVLHAGKELGGRIEVNADRDEPLTLRLERTGTIVGRVLDPDGQPWKNKDLRVYFHQPPIRSIQNHHPEVLRTDADGRFGVTGVLPGLTYQVNVAGRPPRITIASVATGLKLKPGETRDVGDARARMFPD